MRELLSAGKDIYGVLANLCVWVKSNGGMGSLYRSRQDFAGERLIIQSRCEMTEEFTNFLKSQQVQPKVSHKMVSEQDYLVLLEANLGVGVMPGSAVRSSRLACVPVSWLDLSRTVSLYAVSGRQRSAATSTFIKLLRASDWPAQIGTHLLSQAKRREWEGPGSASLRGRDLIKSTPGGA